MCFSDDGLESWRRSSISDSPWSNSSRSPSTLDTSRSRVNPLGPLSPARPAERKPSVRLPIKSCSPRRCFVMREVRSSSRLTSVCAAKSMRSSTWPATTGSCRLLQDKRRTSSQTWSTSCKPPSRPSQICHPALPNTCAPRRASTYPSPCRTFCCLLTPSASQQELWISSRWMWCNARCSPQDAQSLVSIRWPFPWRLRIWDNCWTWWCRRTGRRSMRSMERIMPSTSESRHPPRLLF